MKRGSNGRSAPGVVRLVTGDRRICWRRRWPGRQSGRFLLAYRDIRPIPADSKRLYRHRTASLYTGWTPVPACAVHVVNLLHPLCA
jgi:hypothetical protein